MIQSYFECSEADQIFRFLFACPSVCLYTFKWKFNNVLIAVFCPTVRLNSNEIFKNVSIAYVHTYFFMSIRIHCTKKCADVKKIGCNVNERYVQLPLSPRLPICFLTLPGMVFWVLPVTVRVRVSPFDCNGPCLTIRPCASLNYGKYKCPCPYL